MIPVTVTPATPAIIVAAIMAPVAAVMAAIIVPGGMSGGAPVLAGVVAALVIERPVLPAMPIIIGVAAIIISRLGMAEPVIEGGSYNCFGQAI